MKKHIDLVVGARPNFMKAAPLVAELGRHPDRFSPRLIHTGQHYDHNLSQMFFEQLKMPRPDIFLGLDPERTRSRLRKSCSDWSRNS